MKRLSDNATDMPRESVLFAFQAHGEDIQTLAGGEETSVRVGTVVLKRVLDVDLSVWCQEMLDATTPRGFRIPTPVRSRQGDWAVDGWIATEFVDGLTSLASDPAQVIDVGVRLADAFGEVGSGDLGVVIGRQDRWARADRFVWDEESIDITDAASRVVEILQSRMVDSHEASRVIHGDLSGNVFVDANEVPVVLDFSPFFRPERYASGIVVADNLLWHSADASIVELIAGNEDPLARGLLFRLSTDLLASGSGDSASVDDYLRVIDVLGWT